MEDTSRVVRRVDTEGTCAYIPRSLRFRAEAISTSVLGVRCMLGICVFMSYYVVVVIQLFFRFLSIRLYEMSAISKSALSLSLNRVL